MQSLSYKLEVVWAVLSNKYTTILRQQDRSIIQKRNANNNDCCRKIELEFRTATTLHSSRGKFKDSRRVQQHWEKIHRTESNGRKLNSIRLQNDSRLVAVKQQEQLIIQRVTNIIMNKQWSTFLREKSGRL